MRARPTAMSLCVLGLLQCGDPGADPSPELLAPTDLLIRTSMTLRGIRPSVEELEAVHADPQALEGIVDRYLRSDGFRETIKDLHAELFEIRNDTETQLPARGIVADRGYGRGQVYSSTAEAPLELIADLVTSDRPYTDILTVPYTLADPVVADIFGLPYDPEGPEWQRTVWVDGRPMSGVLSDSQVWRRHVSNAANFQRARANFVSTTFLCEDIGAREVAIDVGGLIDLSDPDAVATAAYTNPSCVGCHSTLDPLAAYFWGFKESLGGAAVTLAYAAGCEGTFFPGDPLRGSYDVAQWCLPASALHPGGRRSLADLRPPASGVLRAAGGLDGGLGSAA